MKLLITGVAGFLGPHVAEFFIKKGWKVVGIDNLTDYELTRTNFDVKKSRKHNLEKLESLGVEFIKQDVRGVMGTENWIKDVDFIVHCAAQPAMTISIEDPTYDFSNNVLGTFNMLTIAKSLNVPFVNCSTIHVYGNMINYSLEEQPTRFLHDPAEMDESQPILFGDVTPLHASKRTTELYTQCFAETYNLRAASFRLTGMYGPGQFGGMDHGWVANFAIRAVKNRPITVFGTDKQVRDILFAEDAARSFYEWFKNGGESTIYNIGGGIENSVSLQECLNMLSRIMNKKISVKFDSARFGDLHYFVCNYSKAQKDFGWKPLISPEEGLKRIVNWIKDNEEIL